jgi:glycosyltransferase involved in cell wall biosynthesis
MVQCVDGQGPGRTGDTVTEGLTLLVVAGMIDRKFMSKVLPLIKSERVRTIYVVRRDFIAGDKITCFSPRGVWQRNLALAELYRLFAILYVLARRRPDVVIGIGLILHGIYTNLLGTLFGKKKILLLMGKNDLALTYPGKRLLQRLLLKLAFLADFIGTRGTRSMRWLVEKGFDGERVFIPHNVFDFDEFKPTMGHTKKYDLIFVGVLRHYKRVDLLIDVVRKLVFEHGLPEVRLAIVGDGALKNSLIAMAKTLGVGDNITFLPSGDGPYVCDLLNQSRIFVMTSQGEGLPMAVIEAMSCGLPVVVFDDADIGDVVRHDENGFLVRYGDTDAFVTAVKNPLTHGELYEHLSKGAKQTGQRFGDDFSLRSTRIRWEAMLENALRKGA